MAYNGFVNWETWNVATVLQNDEDTVNDYRYACRRASTYEEALEIVALKVEEALTDEFESANLSPLLGDLLQSAMEQIDYSEVAEALVDSDDFNDEDDEE